MVRSGATDRCTPPTSTGRGALALRVPHVRPALLLLLLVLIGLGATVAPLRADEAAAAAVVVHCKDGRVLKGVLIRETSSEITLRMAFGEVPIARDEIERIERKEDPASPTGATEPAAPTPAAASAGDGPARRVDDALELELSLPGDEWRFVDPPTASGVRLEATRSDPAMVCQVLLENLPPEEHRADARAVKDATTKALRRRYRAARGLRVEPARQAGFAAWRLAVEVDTRLISARYHLEELRIQKRGYQVTVRVTIPRPGRAAITAAAAAEARRAIAGFAFSAAIGREGRSYRDRRFGLRVELPVGWVALPHLLDDARPVRFLPPSGRGLYRLERAFAEGMATADAWADRFVERQRTAAGRFSLASRKTASVGGLPAVELRYTGTLPAHPSSAASVRRLVWVDRDHVLALCGYTPSDGGGGDPAADALFAGVGQVAPARVDRLLAVAERERNAIAGARKRQDERDAAGALAALEAGLPRRLPYVEALAIRGLAHAAEGDLAAAIRDLGDAWSRLRDPALAAALAKLESRRAKELAANDWKRADRLFRSAIKHDPANRTYRADLVSATVARSRGLTRAGEHEQAVRAAQAAVRADKGEARYQRQLVRAYQDWIRALLRSKTNRDLYKARNLVKKALRLEPGSAPLRSLRERVETELQRRERR